MKVTPETVRQSREYAEAYMQGFMDCLEEQRRLAAEKEFIAQPVPGGQAWKN